MMYRYSDEGSEKSLEFRSLNGNIRIPEQLIMTPFPLFKAVRWELAVADSVPGGFANCSTASDGVRIDTNSML